MKNSQKWNRILTGAAAVSLAIGTMAPMAFAASATTPYNTRTVNVGSGFTAVVQGLVAQDQGHATEFLPIYYLMQGLGKMGYTVNWNGGTRVLNITTPTGVTVTAPTATVGTPGANQMVIQLNGASIMLAPRVVAKDPASGVMTTFAPIYYLNQALKSAGFTNTYNGQSWTLTGTAASQTGTLAASMTVTNQTNGDGSIGNPAVSMSNTAITFSTTLKDAQGNPLPNTAVYFNVSNYGNLPSQLPVVENTSGTVISGTQQSTAEQYTVYTNSNGVAQVSMTGPSGQTTAYEVVATAPYAGPNNTAISTSPAYAEFVASNSAGIAPYATQNQAYSAAMGKPVPITVTLPPNSAGQAQANVLLTLTVAASGSTTPNTSRASFVNTSGGVLGSQIQVTTNSAGVAQAFLADSYGEEVEVSVSNVPNGVNSPNPTFITFAQTGIPAQINNFSISSTQPNIGQNAYISGQLEDSAGNPVPNGQLLVTSPNSNGGNDFAYVSGTTTTTFPLISSTLQTGTPASSAYGDVVTADANGNFSFAVTDTRYNNGTADTYKIYPVSNGEVAGAAITSGIPSGDESIAFQNSTTLQTISIGAVDNFVQNNSNTTLTGLSAQADNGAGGLGQLATASDTGTNPQISDVFVEPQNSAGHHGKLNQSLTYNLSVSNGGLVYSINGVTLTNPAAAVNVQYTPGTGYVVNNSQTINVLSATSLGTSAQGTGSLPEDFEIGVVNNNTGATTLTVQSGSTSSTASINFVGGTPDQVASFTPGNATVAAGQSQTISFQVQDTNGNPVPSVATTIQTDQGTDPFWITQVNGVTLQESLNMGGATASYATEPVPIPLGAVPSAANYSVSIPGVATWSNGSKQATVYSDASGNVSITLQSGGFDYPTSYTGSGVGTTANPSNIAATPTGSGVLGFYTDTTGDSNVVPLFIGSSAPTSAQVGANFGNFVIQGTLGYTGGGGAVTPTTSSVGTISPAVSLSGAGTTSTQILATLPGSSDSLFYAVSATAASAPQTGTSISSITGATAYTLNSTFTTTSGQYVNVYEVSGGVVQAFQSVQAGSAAATAVGAIQNLSIAPGTSAGTVTFSATPQYSGDSFYYLLNSATFTAPNTGTAISTVSGATAYTTGSNIPFGTNTKLNVYEVNSAGAIVAASQTGVTTGVVTSPYTAISTIAVLGTPATVTFTTPAIGDTVTVAGTTFTYVASGASASAGTFTSASDLVAAINASAANRYVYAAGTGPVDIYSTSTIATVAVSSNDATNLTVAATPAVVATSYGKTVITVVAATSTGTINVTVTDGANNVAVVPVSVTSGESANNVAAAINTALNAHTAVTNLYTVTASSATVTLTQNAASTANAVGATITG